MKTESANPFDDPDNPSLGEVVAEQQMSFDLPQTRLGGDIKIPGHHCHWFADRPGRIQRALMVGYSWVDPEEALVNPASLGSDPTERGSSDMGTRVSIASEAEGQNGQALRLYLMKIPLARYKAAKRALNDRNGMIMEAIMKGAVGSDSSGETREDFRARYTRNSRTPTTPFDNMNRR